FVLPISRIAPGVLVAFVLKAAPSCVVARGTLAVSLGGRFEAGIFDKGAKLCHRDFVCAEVKRLADPNFVLRLFILPGQVSRVRGSHQELARWNKNQRHAQGIGDLPNAMGAFVFFLPLAGISWRTPVDLIAGQQEATEYTEGRDAEQQRPCPP